MNGCVIFTSHLMLKGIEEVKILKINNFKIIILFSAITQENPAVQNFSSDLLRSLDFVHYDN